MVGSLVEPSGAGWRPAPASASSVGDGSAGLLAAAFDSLFVRGRGERRGVAGFLVRLGGRVGGLRVEAVGFTAGVAATRVSSD
jgi:hypothetical protein